MICVYKITSPSKKIYIGQTINSVKRFNKYNNYKCQAQPRLYASFKKYGFNNHKLEILSQCKVEELNDVERYYQDLYSSTGSKGLNCMLTNTSDRTGGHSKETILRLRNQKLGTKMSKDSSIKKSEATKGRKRSKSAIEGTRLYWLGRPKNEETKRKISNSLKGRKVVKTKDHIKNNSLAKMKVILDVNTGVFYVGVKEASIYNSINESTLRQRLNGGLKNNTGLIYT